ncbi:MAG: T9SS C-terminal target domain-containing protein [Bacteroidetes bacterium]|nr:MAG: T9SS C-terminal target domain-containing protein [Bacteroidota bacterium]
MNSRLVIFVLLLFTGINHVIYSQIYFSKRYDFLQNATASYSQDIITENFGYILLAEAVPDYQAYRHFGFIILDTMGNRISSDIVFEDSLIGLTTGYPGSFIKTSDNAGFSMVGFAYNYVTGGRWDRGMLWRFDNTLDTLWTKTFSDDTPHDTSFLFRNFRELPDKGYIIVGSHGLVNGSAPIRINLHRVDSLGQLIWRKYYGSGNTHFLPFDVSPTSDGGYVIGAGAYPSNGSSSQDNDPILIKTDSIGNQEWLRYLGNPVCREDYSMIDLANDGNIICGTTYSDSCWGSGEYYNKINIVKIDNSNTIIWDKKYGFHKHKIRFNKIRVLENGDIVAIGSYYYSNDYTWNEIGWILKTDSAGNELWYREYLLLTAMLSMNILYNVVPTQDNGYIACGSVWPYPPDTGTQDSWVLKVDSLGCEAPDQCWVGQEEIWVKTFTPDKPFIFYPNPATVKLTIEFHINQEGTEIELFNLTGQPMRTTRIPPNKDILELDVGQLPKGLYILKVTLPGKRPMMEKVVVE